MIGKVLGLDLGEKSLGIAESDTLGIIAQGIENYTFKDNEYSLALERVLYYVKKDFDINSLVLQKEEVESVRWCTEDEIHLMENNNIFFGTHYESFVKFLNFYNNKEVFYEKRN